MKITNNETFYSGAKVVEHGTVKLSYKLTFSKSCNFIDTIQRVIDSSRNDIFSIELIEAETPKRSIDREKCRHEYRKAGTHHDPYGEARCTKCGEIK